VLVQKMNYAKKLSKKVYNRIYAKEYDKYIQDYNNI
jgi:hypothetical protein